MTMPPSIELADDVKDAALTAAKKMFDGNLNKMAIEGADGFFVGADNSVIPTSAEQAENMEVEGKTFVVFMEY